MRKETSDEKIARLKAARLAKEAEDNRRRIVLNKDEALSALRKIKDQRKKLGLKY